MQYEFKKLDAKAMRRELNRLNAIANKRLRRLEQAGEVSSPAYQAAENYMTILAPDRLKLSFRTMAEASYPELETEYKQVLRFLNSETSTISGIKAVLKRSRESFGKRFDLNKTKKGKQSLSDIYKVFETETWKIYKDRIHGLSCIQTVDFMIEDLNTGSDVDDIVRKLEHAIQNGTYENDATRYDINDTLDDFWGDFDDLLD